MMSERATVAQHRRVSQYETFLETFIDTPRHVGDETALLESSDNILCDRGT